MAVYGFQISEPVTSLLIMPSTKPVTSLFIMPHYKTCDLITHHAWYAPRLAPVRSGYHRYLVPMGAPQVQPSDAVPLPNMATIAVSLLLVGGWVDGWVGGRVGGCEWRW